VSADLAKIKERIRALRAKTTARGCTEAEALAAAELAAKLMRQYGLGAADIEMSRSSARQKTRRPTERSRLYNMIAVCTNTAVVASDEEGELVLVFIGREPWPDIAAYLKVVCDRAIDRAVAEFKRNPFYRRRRSVSTRRAAVELFTRAMVGRLCVRLGELFAGLYSKDQRAAAERHLAVLYPNAVARPVPRRNLDDRLSEAAEHGWRAGSQVGLHHGVRTGDRPAELLMMDVVNLARAREGRKRRDYADLVLRAWDDQEHAEKRDQKQRAAEVNAKAKEQL
jgi:hypothetical protein